MLWLAFATVGLASGLLPAPAEPFPVASVPPDTLSAPALPTVEAARLQGDIDLDGEVVEGAWRQARPATVFTQLDPFEGEPASEATEVRILYDDEALYIGAVLHDSHPVSTRLGRRDSALRDSDWITISLDSYNDHLTAFRFQVNPSGVRRDEALSRGTETRGDGSWDPVWEAATSVSDSGWSSEMRIPLGQLRFRPGAEQEWGIQITRTIARNQETDLLSFTPKAERAGIARYGHLRGIEQLPAPRGLEILPYVLGKAEYLNPPGGSEASFANPYGDGTEQSWSAGLDLKYRLSSNLIVDATANPDFGQVEADPATVNLTAFETRYTEKRPFFVEGSEIFGYGGVGAFRGSGGVGWVGQGQGGGSTQLLYTRRIGRPPQGSVPSEAAYSDMPDASTILGAAKLTGKTEGGWSLGVLEAVTAREMAPWVDMQAARHEAEVAPLSNYLVGRARRELREGQTVIGGIATAVNRDLGDASLASALRSQAYAGGMDFRHEWAQRTWVVSGHLAGSYIAGESGVMESAQRASARYYQRPDADHIALDVTRMSLSGFQGSLGIARSAGRHWRGNLSLSATSPGFEVNDLGYLSTTDRINADVSAQYVENTPGSVFRTWNVGVSTGGEWNFGGDRLDTPLYLRSSGTLLNYWSGMIHIRHLLSGLDDRMTRGGPLARSPAETAFFVMVNSDARKSLTGTFTFRYDWDDMGSASTLLSARIGIKPFDSWDVSLAPSVTRNRVEAQYVTQVMDPLAVETYGGRYVFADLDQTTVSFQTRLNIVFTPDLTLQLYAQPLVANADYGALKELRRPRTSDFDRYGVDKGMVTEEAGGLYRVDPDGAGAAPSFLVADRDYNPRSLRGTGVLRWEWRPGSTLYLVWQQRRSGYDTFGDLDLRRDVEALFRERPENVFMLKVRYWLER